jgi:crotonobetainyl-CoA:carnitine CoA-transferase CaiB-like acyl-CoA transferase
LLTAVSLTFCSSFSFSSSSPSPSPSSSSSAEQGVARVSCYQCYKTIPQTACISSDGKSFCADACAKLNGENAAEQKRKVEERAAGRAKLEEQMAELREAQATAAARAAALEEEDEAEDGK